MKSFNRQNTQDVKRAKKQSKQLRNLKKMKLHNDVAEDNTQQDGFVVVAENEDNARYTSPSGYYVWKDNKWNFLFKSGHYEPSYCSDWCLPDQVEVTLIGKADDKYTETTVIYASFNAG